MAIRRAVEKSPPNPPEQIAYRRFHLSARQKSLPADGVSVCQTERSKLARSTMKNALFVAGDPESDECLSNEDLVRSARS